MVEDGRLDVLVSRSMARERPPRPCAECRRLTPKLSWQLCNTCYERGRRRWGYALRDRRCVGCNAIATDGHHVITKQVLKREHHAHDVWDLANFLPLCRRCHLNHHAWSRRLSMQLLREHCPQVVGFAAELGLVAWLDRHYPDETKEKAA
jgi:hypothetical protein